MPLFNRLVTPYAEALLQITEARQETDQVADQCKQLLDFWNASEAFRGAMESPLLEPNAKKKFLTTLFREQLTPSLLNLLKVLADRQRLFAFDSVLSRYLELFRNLHKITLAKVTSAHALSEKQQGLLSKRLQVIVGGGEVEIDLTIDASLIGGFVISLGSQVIDASLAGQVRRLGLALAKAN